MATLKQMFIDETFYTGLGAWNTAFKKQFDALSDQEKERFFFLASIRIKRLVNTNFLELTDLAPFEQTGVKEATAILVDYWMEYGLNLNRTTGSMSANGFSVSETPPADPDYIPEAVYEVLAQVGLYAYAGLMMDGCNLEDEYPENYKWDGLNYPFKFGYTVDTLGQLPTTNVQYRTYAYTSNNGHWYAWDGKNWKDLGKFVGGGDVSTSTAVSGLPWLTDSYADLTEFGNSAPLNTVVKYSVNADGTNNSQGFLFLVKTSGGLKEFRTWQEAKAELDKKADQTEVDSLKAEVSQLAADIQVIENAWTGNQLMPSSGTSDLSALQGDKGAFDFTADKKLIVTFGTNGHAVTDTIILKVGTQGSYHLIGEGIDATFGATIADTGVVTIKNFTSTGTTAIAMTDLTVKEIEQNPKVAASVGSLGSGTLEDIYKTARGIDVTDSDKNYANIDELGKLMKQNFITNGEKMVKTADTITLTDFQTDHNGISTGKVQYTDSQSGILTGQYDLDITDAGVLVTYTYGTRANIWNRLSAWQSAFGGKALHTGTTVTYNFKSTQIYKFILNKDQTYEITIDDKFEGNNLVKYLTFKTNGQLHGANNTDHTAAATSATGFQVKLSDVMSETAQTASIIFTFPNALSVGDKILELEYTSAPQLLAERHSIAIRNAATRDELNKGLLEKADKSYVDANFMLKKSVIETVTPVLQMDGTGNYLLLADGTVVGDHTLATMVDGEQVDVNFKNADALGTPPSDAVQVFVGATHAIRIPNSSGSAALKWGAKTNPTDVNVKDNFQTHNFRIEKQGDQFNFIKLVDASATVDKTYVDNGLSGKQDKLTTEQLANINADHSAYLTAHQDITGKANKNLDNVSNTDFQAKLQAAGVNTGIFNEFKGVLAVEPTGDHTDLDWYINDADNHIYVWHNSKWNSIGGGATATVDKAAVLNMLGLTDAQLTVLKTTKEFTEAEKTKLGQALTAHQDISHKLNDDSTRLMDATSTADIAIIRRANNQRIQAATYSTGTAIWLKDDRQGADDTYVGITVIDGIPKVSYKKHGEVQKDIDLSKVFDIAGKSLVDVVFTADDDTVTTGKLLV